MPLPQSQVITFRWRLRSQTIIARSRERIRQKQFFVELKRRKVYRVAVAYIVVAWVLIQVATQVSPYLEIPTWPVRLLIFAVALGFPIAVILAWAYDITPAGIVRTADAPAPSRPLPRRRPCPRKASQFCPSLI